MKKKNLLILISIPIITLLTPLILLNYQASTDPEFQSPQYLESYLLAGFIITEIVLTVSSWFLQDKSNVRTELKEHTQDINKGITVDMIKRAFKISKKYGIIRRTYSFIGTPLETRMVEYFTAVPTTQHTPAAYSQTYRSEPIATRTGL